MPIRRINHVIVLMLENRALDHLFGFFKPGTGRNNRKLIRYGPHQVEPA